MTEQDAKSKVHLRLLGRSIGLPSEAREVIEIVWKAAAEFFQAQQPMPAWMQYDPATDVLTIHGRKYAASLFGNSGFLGNAGDILRIEQGSDDVVTVTKIEPEQADEFATGGLRTNYIPPIPIRTGLGQNPMKPVPPVPPAGAQGEPVGEVRQRQGKSGIFVHWYKPPFAGDLLYTAPPAAAINEQMLEVVKRYLSNLEVQEFEGVRYDRCGDFAHHVCSSCSARKFPNGEKEPHASTCGWFDHAESLRRLVAAAEAEKAKGGV